MTLPNIHVPFSTHSHPIDPAIRVQIIDKLVAVERDENVRILYACESGSRGWGFASPDSDCDVRFIYARPVREYLRILPVRDVIEETPGPVFDVSGWDLRKALGLLAKGNATLIEWLSSPVVYMQDDAFVNDLRSVAAQVYQPVRSFHHYASMARGNYREYLQGDTVRAKKYLYVLRPVLAAQWVLERPVLPPMAFEELVHATVQSGEVIAEIEQLLAQKRKAGEADLLPRRPVLNMFIERLLAGFESARPLEPAVDLTALDSLFERTLLAE
jgi:uncharacterized protein